MNKLIRGSLVSLAVVGAAAANAAVDTASVTGAGADIALVGAAVFTVMVGIKLVKWIRRAL